MQSLTQLASKMGIRTLGQMLREPKGDFSNITSFFDDDVREQLYPTSYYMPEAPERETCFVATQELKRMTSGHMASKSSTGVASSDPPGETEPEQPVQRQ